MLALGCTLLQMNHWCNARIQDRIGLSLRFVPLFFSFWDYYWLDTALSGAQLQMTPESLPWGQTNVGVGCFFRLSSFCRRSGQHVVHLILFLSFIASGHWKRALIPPYIIFLWGLQAGSWFFELERASYVAVEPWFSPSWVQWQLESSGLLVAEHFLG